MPPTLEGVVLKVEGWIGEEDVDLLAAEGERYLQQAGRLVLDVSGVRLIEEGGIRLLQRWTEEGLVVRGASHFIQTVLEMAGVSTDGQETAGSAS
jgi:hypothetical protein